MSVVSLLGVKVLNNPAKFAEPYQFEITFECLEQLQRGTILRLVLRQDANVLNRYCSSTFEDVKTRSCYE